MQFGELQVIAEECQSLLQLIRGGVEGIRVRVKEKRREIEELRREVLGLKGQVKKKMQLEKYISAVQAEIERVRNFTGKERMQSKKLQDLGDKAMDKSNKQERRISEIQTEHLLLHQFEGYIEESLQSSKQYDTLRQQMKALSTTLLAQKMGNSLQAQRKKQQLLQLQTNNVKIDIQIANIEHEIAIQHEIINKISSLSRQEAIRPIKVNDFDILGKEEKAFFKKREELDIWEKHELQNVMQKREIDKQRERKIGSILRQRFSTQTYKEKPILNRSFNHSGLTQASRYESPKLKETKDLRFISNDRMKELEKNKRIRTRHTQPKLQNEHFSPPSHTYISQQPESPNPSIIAIYQKFKRQRMDSTPPYIKLLRSHNRKRTGNQSKGVPIQHEPFD